jgi:hypothetical protein
VGDHRYAIFEFALLLVVSGGLLILLAALLAMGLLLGLPDQTASRDQ